MLSYQHSYHAGNLADVHKHSLVAWMLGYLCRKDKPVSYLETHAGRGLYDLSDDDARKTGEARQGIERVQDWFGAEHPYARAIALTRNTQGAAAYPGSPLIAAHLLRPTDKIHLAELHPGEHAKLAYALSPFPADCHFGDGIEMAFARVPPMPRRGLLLMDPSYEIKSDYDTMPRVIGKLARAWNVGIIVLWYPILTSSLHKPMIKRLTEAHPDALLSEVHFPPARPGHGMIGSGLFVINPPFGLDAEATRISHQFAQVQSRRSA